MIFCKVPPGVVGMIILTMPVGLVETPFNCCMFNTGTGIEFELGATVVIEIFD